MKKALLLSTLIISCHFYGQAQKNIKGLIQAERSFAATTVANGIKAGFMANLDSTGVVFNGPNVQNGMAFYGTAANLTAIVNWGPEHAVISASGDFGFTTGPYHIHQNTLQDPIISRGQYTTVWHITPKGEWKFLADMGIRYPVERSIPETNVSMLDLSTLKTDKFSLDEMKANDQQLNESINQKGAAAFNPYLSANSWFNIQPQAPVQGIAAIQSALEKMPASLQLTYLDGSIATAGDMAYCYGKVSNGTRNATYMRVWTKQDGKWIILLHVLIW